MWLSSVKRNAKRGRLLAALRPLRWVDAYRREVQEGYVCKCLSLRMRSTEDNDRYHIDHVCAFEEGMVGRTHCHRAGG